VEVEPGVSVVEAETSEFEGLEKLRENIRVSEKRSKEG
jgi:hypothetical protein